MGEIVGAAKEMNRNLKALRAEQQTLEAGRLKVGLPANPVLDLEAGTGAIGGTPEENVLSIGISQEFNTGGKREKRIAAADAELATFAARAKEQERLSLLEVKLAVYDLQLAQALLTLSRETVALNEQLLQVARERFAAGDVAELEVNLARVEAARSAGELAEAGGEVGTAGLALLALIGGAPGDTLTVVDSREPEEVKPSLEKLKSLALGHRPDLQIARLERAQGEAELQLARAERVPNLTAGIGLTRESTLTSLGGLEEKDTEYLLGVRLSFPIPVFDQNQGAIRAAHTRIGYAGEREALARQAVEIEVERAHGRLAASERTAAIYSKEIVPQLSENLKIVQEAYRLGEIGIAAVIEEQKKYQEVNEKLLRALHQRDSARARLEAAVGLEWHELNGGNQ